MDQMGLMVPAYVRRRLESRAYRPTDILVPPESTRKEIVLEENVRIRVPDHPSLSVIGRSGPFEDLLSLSPGEPILQRRLCLRPLHRLPCGSPACTHRAAVVWEDHAYCPHCLKDLLESLTA